MTRTEIEQEALANATHNQSTMNYAAIFTGFEAKGIPASEIKPRENVFTFHAWKALGRSVKKGEHGVKVVTFISCNGEEQDQATGETKPTSYRRPHTTTVFHISQTETNAEREARGAKPHNERPAYKGWRNNNGRQEPTHRADYVRDPGEDAADRWNETH